MSKYKQIAEMTRIAFETEVFDESDAEIAVDEGLLDCLLNLYNADYRKASDIQTEIFDWIDEHSAIVLDEFGFRESFKIPYDEFIEFKKKYTEGER